MTKLLNLDTQTHRSRVLDTWLSTRDGAAERTGNVVVAQSENSHTEGLGYDSLAALMGAAFRPAAGEAVTEDTAMRVSAVYSCVSLLTGALATLPLGVFERSGGSRAKADHDYWWLFNEQASENWTSAAAWEYVVRAKLLYGDGFGELLRPSKYSSRVIGWKPLHPLAVDPFKHDGRVLYRVYPSDGPAYTLDSSDVIHLPSLGFDGLRSPSPITNAAREVVSAAIAAQKHSGKFFADGANFDYALKTASKLKQSQLEMLKASLLGRVQNGGRGPLILDGGLEPTQISVNSKDAEILATRLFTVEQICGVLGVPPHMIGHTDKQTSFGTGIEQQGISFVRYTLQRHLTPIAQELNRKLWPVRQKYFVEHITAALERGDLKSRYEAYRIAMGRAGEAPWMDADEVRRLENMPPNSNLKPNGGADAQPTE